MPAAQPLVRQQPQLRRLRPPEVQGATYGRGARLLKRHPLTAHRCAGRRDPLLRQCASLRDRLRGEVVRLREKREGGVARMLLAPLPEETMGRERERRTWFYPCCRSAPGDELDRPNGMWGNKVRRPSSPLLSHRALGGSEHGPRASLVTGHLCAQRVCAVPRLQPVDGAGEGSGVSIRSTTTAARGWRRCATITAPPRL